ncbi:RCC1 domain-containing protein [Spirilliplanes yamanashiensis]|uniref:RCC1 domain-containing protein n=1 Tax=Spirilliplanes yamanashiensis TaxID=42233 RepID=UPI00194F44C7|nr:hypothetical protein [Spirilliplanes yamanashiensis]MDP9815597.1 hypothetical protein [Spirilliplanes yamanashiensis]
MSCVRTRPALGKIAAGGDHTCAARVNGTVWCWGDNTWGQVGTGVAGGVQTTPRRVPGLTGVTDVAAGDRSTCAVAEAARRVWCWGSDADGQLGDGGGTPATVPAPVPVTLPAGTGVFQRVTIGRAHACAHTDTPDVWCWGADGSGQLGNGPAGPATAPQRIGDLGIGVDAGGDSTCTTSAPVTCWGDNSSGQLGTGDRTDRDVPTVGALGELRGSPFVEAVFGWTGPLLSGVAVGDDHACAVDATSGAYCWGSGADGRLGTGGTADSDVPVLTRLLPGPATGVTARPAAGALDVGWERPSETGAASLATQLAVAIAPDGLTASCDPFASAAPTAANSCTVRDLTGGRRYAVTVGVGNAAGVTFSELAYGTPRPGGGGGSLPITGAGLSAYLLLAAVLVAAGTGVIVLVSRSGPRRRRA